MRPPSVMTEYPLAAATPHSASVSRTRRASIASRPAKPAILDRMKTSILVCLMSTTGRTYSEQLLLCCYFYKAVFKTLIFEIMTLIFIQYKIWLSCLSLAQVARKRLVKKINF